MGPDADCSDTGCFNPAPVTAPPHVPRHQGFQGTVLGLSQDLPLSQALLVSFGQPQEPDISMS